MAGLQNALDNGYGVRHCLDFLKGVKDLHCFILQAAVTLLLLHWGTITKVTRGEHFPHFLLAQQHY